MNPIIQKSLKTALSPRQQPFSDNLSDIQKEIRHRRQLFIESHISIYALVQNNGYVDENLIDDLSEYLSKRIAFLWNHKHPADETFGFRFSKLTLFCLVSRKVGGATVDDIIQIAGCLVRSRKVFTVFAKDLLPDTMIGELFDFTETYDDSFFNPSFEDAVLGAICVLLGVLKDPIEKEDEEQ